MIRSLLFCAFLLLSFLLSGAQTQTIPKKIEKPKIALLGTFHFGQTSDLAAITMEDVLGKRRQSEIKELVDLLAEYQPTKVLVEYPYSKQDTLQARYQKYLVGDLTMTVNETYQVGFRLAEQLGHPKVYGIDYRMDLPFEELMAFCEAKNLSDKLQQFIKDIQAFTAKETKALENQKLSDFLHSMNSDDSDRESRKIYLQDMLDYCEPGNEVGVKFTLAWYERNLIMMNNILSCIDGPDERILILVGASHRAMIKEFLLDREDVEYIEIAEYIRPKIHRE